MGHKHQGTYILGKLYIPWNDSFKQQQQNHLLITILSPCAGRKCRALMPIHSEPQALYFKRSFALKKHLLWGSHSRVIYWEMCAGFLFFPWPFPKSSLELDTEVCLHVYASCLYEEKWKLWKPWLQPEHKAHSCMFTWRCLTSPVATKPFVINYEDPEYELYLLLQIALQEKKQFPDTLKKKPNETRTQNKNHHQTPKPNGLFTSKVI